MDARARIRELEAEVAQLQGKLRVLREAEQARIGELHEESERLRKQVEEQRSEIDGLKKELEDAKRARKRQAAPHRRRRRLANPKRPGRQRNHRPANRPVPDQIDEEVPVPLEQCPDCSGPVEDVQELDPQVQVEIPEVRPKVRRFHNQSGYCPCCKKRVRSRHADQCSTANGAAGVQIGPRALSLAVDLKVRIGVPFRKVTGIFRLFFGFYISPGALARAAQRIAGRLEPTYQGLIHEARSAAIVSADETGWHLAGMPGSWWLWVFASEQPAITLFAIRDSRGGNVVREILTESFEGILRTDGWCAYVTLTCAKSQCNAHLLRRAADLLEVQKRGAARFPLAVKELLQDGIELKARLPELAPQTYWQRVDGLQDRLDRLLRGNIQEPANRRFANHLRRHQDEILLHLYVPELSATNNFGEREIRPGVIARKISSGNRSRAGALAYEVIASVSRTAERNGLLLPDVLPSLLCSPDRLARLPVLPQWKSRRTSATSTTSPASASLAAKTPAEVSHERRTAARSPPRRNRRGRVRRSGGRVRHDPRANNTRAPP